jgi:hypothetical protein
MQYPRRQDGLSFPQSHKLPPTISDFGAQPKRKRANRTKGILSGQNFRKAKIKTLRLYKYTVKSRKFSKVFNNLWCVE